MKKHLPLILSAIMVLSLFAAVAMAAVNVEVCPTCNQGEMRDSTGSPYTKDAGRVKCSKGGGNSDTKYEIRINHYTGCNNSACSERVLDWIEVVDSYVVCNH